MTLYNDLKSILEKRNPHKLTSKIISAFKNHGFGIEVDSVKFILNNKDSKEKKLYSLVDSAIS